MRSWIFNGVDEHLVPIPIRIPMQGSILRIDQSEALFVRLPRVIFDDPGGSSLYNVYLHTTLENIPKLGLFRKYIT